MDFAGHFETHFTLRLDGTAGVEELRNWGAAHGLKCLHIILDRGASASQPMLTRHGSAQRISIDLKNGERAELWAAAPELSLAWKILWLETDMYPQGKDLYDATLLAEQFRLPRDLLVRVLQPSARGSQAAFGPACIRGWEVDWEDFQREYPTVPGTASDWQERLVRALEPTFAESNPD